MGISSSKSKTTTSQSSTTTPTNPQWVTDSAQNWSKQVSDFGKTDPYSLVAGPSTLQQQAFTAAQALTGNTAAGDANNLALLRAQNAGNAPANLAAGTGYTAQNFGGANTGPAQNYTASGYNAALSDPATLAQAQTQGYTAASASAAQVAAIERAKAEQAQAASMLDNFSAYQNPATQALVDTTLADFDQSAGITRAQQAAAAAKNGAFGGSRYGIQEAQTEGELARARAAADAQLRDRAFTQSVGMAQFDAGNRQQTNALNAQLGTNVNLANSAAENARLSQNADRSTNVSMANAGFANDAARFGADAFNNASLFNAGQQNTNTWRNQDSLNEAGQFNSNALNAAGQFNVGQSNQFALTNSGYRQQAGLANMDANNAASQFGANAFNQMSQFNAGQQDNMYDRQLAAAGLSSNIANSMDANTRANIGLLGDLGAQQQQLEALRARAPAVYMELMAQLQGSQNFGLFRGEESTGNSTSTTKQSQAWGPALMAAAAQAAAAGATGGASAAGGGAAPISSGFSDIRLKTDVEKVGQDGPLGIYEWTYRNGLGLPEGRYRGVMAQEVAKFVPDLLGEPIAGYMTVRYTPERVG